MDALSHLAQSHFVNARTNIAWKEENAGHVVRGRALWLSPPLKILLKVSDDEPMVISEEGGGEAPDEYVTGPPLYDGAVRVDMKGVGGLAASETAFVLGMLSAFVLLVVIIVRRRSRRSGSGSFPQVRYSGYV